MLMQSCPDGTHVLIDANTIYYHMVQFPPLSKVCSEFLHRVS